MMIKTLYQTFQLVDSQLVDTLSEKIFFAPNRLFQLITLSIAHKREKRKKKIAKNVILNFSFFEYFIFFIYLLFDSI